MAGSSWTNQVVASVIIAGPNASLLVYSPSPAHGNLVDSIAAAGGTDPYGNTVFPGINSYQTITHARSALNSGAVFLVDGSSNIYSLQTSDLGAGPSPYLQVSTPAGNTVLVSNAGAVVATDPNNAGQPEVWHSLGTLSGYTVNAARYRLVPDNNEVEFDINVTSGGANALTTVFSTTLASPYLPITLSKTYAMASNAGTFVNPRLGITTAGAVSIVMTANTAAGVVGGAFMPTD